MPINFKNIETTRASLGGNYVRPGKYIVRIDRVKEGNSSVNGDFIAFEMTVFHAFDGEHKVGENITHMLMAKHVSWLSNFKAAVMGILSCEEEEVTQEAAAEIVGEKQPLSGLIVNMNAWEIITKQNKKPFTKVAYEGEVPEDKWQGLLTANDRVAIGLDSE